MDKPLYSFASINQGLNGWLIAPLLIAALCLAGILYFRKNTTLDYNRRNIIVMVLSFIGIIGVGTAAMKLYSQWRLKPVEIYTNRIVTPYGETPLSNISDFYIKLENKYKPLRTDIVLDSAHYFFLIEKNEKTHVLSQGDYPIYDILDNLNRVIDSL